jgi:catechol 2,3-dioxygenase-like lactoylglutathione lyase family enzyme
MVPMLPCPDIDEMADFWTGLGLTVTYHQRRPNPYVALARGGIDLHYFGMDGVDPEQSYSTCGIVVPDTAALYQLFTDGLRARYGRVPVTGLPRITRPRRRANNAGLSGFSLVDPAGNWVRVSRAPDGGQSPRAVDDRVEWVSTGGGPLARAVENAVVVADSHGDVDQALRTLTSAVARHRQAPVPERTPALAYLVELQVRAGDLAAAGSSRQQLAALADESELTGQDRAAVSAALAEVDELLGLPPGG